MNYNTGNFQIHNPDGTAFLTAPSFEALPFVRHAFSTRLGGISENEFSSMNLNFGRGDSAEHVRENFCIFCKAAGFEPDSLVASAQDHHTVVRHVTKQDAGIGIWKPRDLQSVDALITNDSAVTLVIYMADCVPILFADPVHRAVGAAHAGWRGTVAKIAQKTLEEMHHAFGTMPQDVSVAIGPSIGPDCYEVDESVAEQFRALKELNLNKVLFPRSEQGKYLLNLWEVNRQILEYTGVPANQITVSNICTQCNADWLFSHRATQGKRGGMAALIAVKEENAQ